MYVCVCCVFKGEDETVSFIDLPPNSMSKVPEKGILKKQGFGLMLGDSTKDKWPDDSHSDNLELIAQQESNIPSSGVAQSTSGVGGNGGGGVAGVGVLPPGVLSGQGVADVGSAMKNLNGYHEDILEALRNAAQRSSTNTPSGSISEEMLRKTLAECAASNTIGIYQPEYRKGSSSKTGSKENICETQSHVLSDAGQTASMLHHHRQQQDMDDDTPSVGPLRIRNLEDLIRQLEQHSSRHMSPSGSEDIRMSETEADRHYRVDSSAACSESSHG
jgi:hypothetical protein